MHVCHRCGTEWTSDQKRPGFKDICEGCSAYLHCCMNCRFYDPSAHNSCRIPNTEWVADKARGNFCDEFEFRDGPWQAPNSAAQDRAKNDLDALFGGKLEDKDQKPTDFDSLFGD